MKTRVLIIGGFLGAGKTTTLWSAAKALTAQGHKVGLVTNDQASELVDTKFLEPAGGGIAEVSGSCFCCNFPGYMEALDSFKDRGIDIVLSEPVGSCTDLSATIVQPIKDLYADRISLGPLSVLADTSRLKDILKGETSGLHPSAAYIVRKQLEEADFIVINKADLYPAEEIRALKEEAEQAFPLAEIYVISALTGDGVEEWMDACAHSEKCGTHLLTDIDYDTYAEGEAVLGWLNATIGLHAAECDWEALLHELLDHLSSRFDANHQAVGHVKILIDEDKNLLVGNVVGDHSTLQVRGTGKGGVQDVTMTLNARVEMPPQELEQAVLEELQAVVTPKAEMDVQVLKCLQPGRPNPTHRYRKVV